MCCVSTVFSFIHFILNIISFLTAYQILTFSPGKLEKIESKLSLICMSVKLAPGRLALINSDKVGNRIPVYYIAYTYLTRSLNKNIYFSDIPNSRWMNDNYQSDYNIIKYK